MRARRWAVAALWLPLAAAAADVRVLAAGAPKPLVAAVAPGFERDTGHRVFVDTDTAGALTRRILAGAPFDLVIVTSAGAASLAKEGKLADGPPVPLARVGIGVAVKAGARHPDIGDVPALRRALREARAVAMIDPAAGGSSGIYLARLFDELGIADEVKRKAVLVPGGLAAQKLVSGEADIALQQMSELRLVPGASVVGPIPTPVQSWTEYVGAVSASARDRAASAALLAALKRAAVAERLKDMGMELP